LPNWTWDVLSDKWEEGLQHLMEFAKRNGHAKVPVGRIVDGGYALGHWVQVQRRMKGNTSSYPRGESESLAVPGNVGERSRNKDNDVRQARIDRLESIPGWSWNPKRERWGVGFAKLLEYVNSHGDARVPLAYVTPEGFRLGNWIAIARRTRSKGQLSADRTKELDALPGWSWGILDDAWEEGLCILVDHIRAGGDPNVPRGYVTASGYRLGAWIDRQRLLWIDGRLDQHRAEQLNNVPGWSWGRENGLRGSLDWDGALRRLLEYLAREGHVAVPRDHETSDGFRLGDWVRYQRKSRTRLSEERQERLDELPGWKWNARMPKELRWEQALQALGEFVAYKGHARVAKDFVTDGGFRLGSWVQNQRSEIDRLSLARKARLEALPGWTWDAFGDRWEEGYRHIAEFAKREGHAKVRHDFVEDDGYRLGSWVHNQRNQRMKMPEQRRSRLEALPGWSWPHESLEWNDWIVRLREFATKNGHTRVPQLFKTSDGFLLGRWVNSRRTTRDRLSPEQQAELESLPGWVWRVT
jgi:hypothetical protein